MVSGRTLTDEISAVHCYDQTRTRAASIFFIFPSDLGLHESTVGVALGSHIAERKRVRAGSVRKSVFYSISRVLAPCDCGTMQAQLGKTSVKNHFQNEEGYGGGKS